MSVPPSPDTRVASFLRLTEAVHTDDDRTRHAELFRVLWGLPAALQLGLPIALEALPQLLPSGHFDHQPELLARMELLAASTELGSRLDPALWLGRSCDPMPWGEAALCFGVSYLCEAVNTRWSQEMMTSGSVSAVMRVITARETLAFRRSDPAGAREFEAFVDGNRRHLPVDPALHRPPPADA